MSQKMASNYNAQSAVLLCLQADTYLFECERFVDVLNAGSDLFVQCRNYFLQSSFPGAMAGESRREEAQSTYTLWEEQASERRIRKICT